MSVDVLKKIVAAAQAEGVDRGERARRVAALIASARNFAWVGIVDVTGEEEMVLLGATGEAPMRERFSMPIAGAESASPMGLIDVVSKNGEYSHDDELFLDDASAAAVALFE